MLPRRVCCGGHNACNIAARQPGSGTWLVSTESIFAVPMAWELSHLVCHWFLLATDIIFTLQYELAPSSSHIARATQPNHALDIFVLNFLRALDSADQISHLQILDFTWRILVDTILQAATLKWFTKHQALSFNLLIEVSLEFELFLHSVKVAKGEDTASRIILLFSFFFTLAFNSSAFFKVFSELLYPVSDHFFVHLRVCLFLPCTLLCAAHSEPRHIRFQLLVDPLIRHECHSTARHLLNVDCLITGYKTWWGIWAALVDAFFIVGGHRMQSTSHILISYGAMNLSRREWVSIDETSCLLSRLPTYSESHGLILHFVRLGNDTVFGSSSSVLGFEEPCTRDELHIITSGFSYWGEVAGSGLSISWCLYGPVHGSLMYPVGVRAHETTDLRLIQLAGSCLRAERQGSILISVSRSDRSRHCNGAVLSNARSVVQLLGYVLVCVFEPVLRWCIPSDDRSELRRVSVKLLCISPFHIDSTERPWLING